MNRKNLKNRLYQILLFTTVLLLFTQILTGCGKGKEITASSLIKVTFSGLNGEGTAVLSFDKDSLITQLSEEKPLTERQKENITALADDLYKDYSISKSDGLSNGDSIEIGGALEKDVLKELGCTIHNDTVTMTVEGLIEPLTLTASDFIILETGGFDGCGTAYARFDSDAFAQTVAERWVELYPEEDPDGYYELESFYNCAYNTGIVLDKEDGFSNGDTVTGTISQKGEEIPECGIIFEAGDYSKQISDLAEPQEVDLASAVDISFIGVIPNITVVYDIDYDQPFVRSTSLYGLGGGTTAKLHNGDVYTLDIAYDEQELLSAGYIAAGSTASATVEGLPSIDFTLSGMDDPLLADMIVEAEEQAVQNVKDNYGSAANYILEERDGWILWDGMRTAPEAVSLGTRIDDNFADNMLFLTYHTVVPVRMTDGTAESGDIFTVMARRSVLLNADNTLSSENNWDISRFYTLEEAKAYVQEICQRRLGEEAVLTEAAADTSQTLNIDLAEVKYEIAQADPSAPAVESIALENMASDYSNRSEIWETMTDPYGNEYINTIAFYTGDHARADYLTRGKYTRFTATLSTYNDAGTDTKMSMYIWGDDKVLMAVDNYRRSDLPVEICLDITGVQRLSFQTACYGRNDNPWLFLSNGAFENTGDAKQQEIRKAALADVPIPAFLEMENRAYSGLITDIRGNALRDSYDLRADRNGWMRIRLDGAYTRFTADIGIAEAPYYFDTSASLTAVADGEVVGTWKNLSLENPAAILDLDVTNVNILELCTSPDTDDNSGLILSIGNTVLEEIPTDITDVEVKREETVFAETDEAVMAMFTNVEEQAEEGEEVLSELACGDYKYMIIRRPCNYSTALFAAQRIGGTLAMPKGTRANEALKALVEESGMYEFWIGAQRQNMNSETWVWADGEIMGESTFWDYGQPDNYDSVEDCLMFRYDGTWSDRPGEEELPFIVQLPAVSGGPAENAVSLIDLIQTDGNYTDQERTYYDGIFDPASLRLNANGRGWAAYDLEGKYKTLYFDLYVAENSDSRTRACFAVFGDGELLYDTYDLKRSDPHRQVTVDVSGVKTVKLMTLYYGTNDDIWVDVVSAWLLPADAADGTVNGAAEMLVTDVLSMETVDASRTDTDRNLTMDAQGNLHPGWIIVDAAEEGYVMYNTAGGYTTLSGEVCAGPYTARGESAYVKIILDGQEVELIEDFTEDSDSRHFKIDLTGTQTVRFETGHEGEGRDNCVYLAGLTLK